MLTRFLESHFLLGSLGSEKVNTPLWGGNVSLKFLECYCVTPKHLGAALRARVDTH